jgi:hypothetical protein
MNVLIELRNGNIESVVSDESLSVYVANWETNCEIPTCSALPLRRIDQHLLQTTVSRMLSEVEPKTNCYQLNIYEIFNMMNEEDHGKE